jgi:dTDP-4-dehydrorhamnose reductase
MAAQEDGQTAVSLGHDEIEVTNPRSVHTRLAACAPDVIVNCAAYVQVDEAEARPNEAFHVNAIGALNVARTAEALSALCVFVSSDYVFDGEKSKPYTEDDIPRPINVYGTSKLAGEFLTKQSCARWLIVRVASLFGRAGARGKGGNFVEAILRKAAANEELRVVQDIFISPTYTRHAARALVQLLRTYRTGTVHLTNRGTTTWYEFAKHALELAGVDASIRPMSSHDSATAAVRPRMSALEPSHTNRPSPEMGSWEEALSEYLMETGRLRSRQ